MLTDYPDPLAVFRAAVEALKNGRWQALAGMCDPASLQSFKRQVLEGYTPIQPQRVMTVEEYLRHSPETPRVVAEYYVAQYAKQFDPAPRLKREFPRVDGVEALRALSPAEVFARWLEGRSVGHQLSLQAEEGVMPASAVPEIMASMLELYDFEALGAVPDGDRVAHVVYRRAFHARETATGDDDTEYRRWMERLSAEERELSRDLGEHGDAMIAATRRQPDGSWRLLADYDFLHVGSVSVGRVEARPDAQQDSPDGT